MRMLLAVLLGAIVGVGTGCGGASTAEACVITPAGAKLCAEDGAAYCRAYARGALDAETVGACGSVGVDVVPAGPEPAGADALVEQCVAAGGAPPRCDGIRDTPDALILEKLTNDMATCIRNGGIPRYCVTDSPAR